MFIHCSTDVSVYFVDILIVFFFFNYLIIIKLFKLHDLFFFFVKCNLIVINNEKEKIEVNISY